MSEVKAMNNAWPVIQDDYEENMFTYPEIDEKIFSGTIAKELVSHISKSTGYDSSTSGLLILQSVLSFLNETFKIEINDERKINLNSNIIIFDSSNIASQQILFSNLQLFEDNKSCICNNFSYKNIMKSLEVGALKSTVHTGDILYYMSNQSKSAANFINTLLYDSYNGNIIYSKKNASAETRISVTAFSKESSLSKLKDSGIEFKNGIFIYYFSKTSVKDSNIFDNIRSHPSDILLNKLREISNNANKYHTFFFTDDAKKILLKSSKDINAKMVSNFMRYLMAFSTAFHVIDENTDKTNAFAIDAYSIEKATILMETLKRHKLHFIHIMSKYKESHGEDKILSWIAKNGYNNFSLSQCYSAVKGSFRNRGKFIDTLDELEKKSFIRKTTAPERTGSGRPLSQVYEVNPYLSDEE